MCSVTHIIYVSITGDCGVLKNSQRTRKWNGLSLCRGKRAWKTVKDAEIASSRGPSTLEVELETPSAASINFPIRLPYLEAVRILAGN